MEFYFAVSMHWRARALWGGGNGVAPALREMTVWFIVDAANLRDVYMFLLFASAERPVL